MENGSIGKTTGLAAGQSGDYRPLASRKTRWAAVFLATLSLSCACAFGADLEYKPDATIPGGNYEDITGYDNSGDLKLKTDGTVAFIGANGQPFVIYGPSGATVERRNIMNVWLSGGGAFNFGASGVGESWTVQNGGRFVSDLTGGSSKLCFGQFGGSGEFIAGVNGVNNNIFVRIDNDLEIGGSGHSGIGGGRGGDGEMEIHGGVSAFRSIKLGGNVVSGAGTSAGEGSLFITNGDNRFGGGTGPSLSLGGSGGGTSDGGKGEITIEGGRNYFVSKVEAGGEAGSNTFSIGTAGEGGSGWLTVSNGDNIFTNAVTLGGSYGYVDLTGNPTYGDFGEGTLTIYGGHTVFQGEVKIGGGESASVTDVNGGKGTLDIYNGTVVFHGVSGQVTGSVGGATDDLSLTDHAKQGVTTIYGGTLKLDNYKLQMRSGTTDAGVFELQAPGTLAAANASVLRSHKVTLVGALSFDLGQADPATPVLDITNVADAGSFGAWGVTVDIARFSDSADTSFMLARTNAGDLSSYTNLTVNGVDIADTRAAGAVLTTFGTNEELHLDLANAANAQAKRLYWMAFQQASWNLTETNFSETSVGYPPPPNIQGDTKYLPGDTVIFNSENLEVAVPDFGCQVTIADYGVAVKEMIIEYSTFAAWEFSGGDIDGQIIFRNNTGRASFDTRAFRQSIIMDGTNDSSGGGGAVVAGSRTKKLYAANNKTMTFAGLDQGILVNAASFYLGEYGTFGTMVFSNNEVGVNATVNNSRTGGYMDVIGGSLRFLNNRVAAVDVSQIWIRGSGTNNFINNGNLTDGLGALYAATDDAWDAGTGAGESGTVTIASATNIFDSNQSSVSGGAIYAEKTIDITGSSKNTFSENVSAVDGGAIASGDDLTISGGTNIFKGNRAAGKGGALVGGYNFYDTLAITDGTNSFIDNKAGDKGGAIYVHGKSTILAGSGDITFRGNVQKAGSADEKANAIYFGTYYSKTVLAAADDYKLNFFDPIETEGIGQIRINGQVDANGDVALVYGGTVLFDTHHSEITGNLYLHGGTTALANGAVLGDHDQSSLLFIRIDQGANLLVDTGKDGGFNALSAEEMIFKGSANGTGAAKITADMTNAVMQGETGATTNLVLLTGQNKVSVEDGEFQVDVTNFAGVDGKYLLVDASSGNFYFSDKYVGTVNGVEVDSSGKINARYGGLEFDDSSRGYLYFVQIANDVARNATWDGGDGTWDETTSNWTLSDPDTNPDGWKVFKNGDDVSFGGVSSDAPKSNIVVDATGTSTAVVVGDMGVWGSGDWTFSGDGINGNTLTMATTGTTVFENDTEFGLYDIASGTLKIVAGKTMTGDVVMRSGATLSVGYGVGITQELEINNGSNIVVDMTGATTTGAGLKANTINLILPSFNVEVTGFAAVDAGLYTVIEDASGVVDFSGFFSGTINGQASPIAGTPNIRYGSIAFDTGTVGKLNLVTTGSDGARNAVWDGGTGVWSETNAHWTLDGNNPDNWKVFKNDDTVIFGDITTLTNDVRVEAYGDDSALRVARMDVEGTADWVFGGHDIESAGDFNKSGTGSVKFQNTTTFNEYAIAEGTLKTVADAALNGTVTLAGGASLQAEHGTTINGTLIVAGAANLDIDMTGASTSNAAVTASSLATIGSATPFNVNLVNAGAINGAYTVIDAGTTFDFTGAYVGTVNGQAAPIVTPPNERYGKTAFDTATAGKLVLAVTGADIARSATYAGTDGDWSESGANWNLDGSASKYFKAGDAVIFEGTSTQDVVVNPTAPETTMHVSDMTVRGGNMERWFSGAKIVGQALADPAFGEGRLLVSGVDTVAGFANEIDFRGGIVVEDSSFLVFNYDTKITNGNSISGDGVVAMVGAGELVLTGDNAYAGGTQIYSGTLTAGSATALGSGVVAIYNDALLKIDFDGALENVFDNSGTGKVEVVAGREVSIDDSTKVDMTVSGTLGGAATYNSLIVKTDATLSPGNSPGTITVNTGATFEKGSTYEYEIDITTPTAVVTDLLKVDGGKVVIEEGAQLKVVFIAKDSAPAGGYSEVTDPDAVADAVEQTDGWFKVIATADASEGFKDEKTLFELVDTWSTKFSQAIMDGGEWTAWSDKKPEDLRDENGYWIQWSVKTPEFVNEVTGYATPNAMRVAAAMDAITLAGDEGSIDKLYKGLADDMPATDPAGLAAAFNQLTGEAYASGRHAVSHLQHRFIQQLPSTRNRLMGADAVSGFGSDQAFGSDRVDSPARFLTWASVGGDWLNQRNNGSFSGYKVNTGGVQVGGDWRIGQNAFLGFAFGFDDADIDYKRLRSSDDVEAFHFALYGGLRRGEWFLDGHVGYTNNRHEVNRYVTAGTFAASLRGKYNDDLYSVGVEAGRRFQFCDWSFIPSLGLDYLHLDSPGFTEKLVAGAPGAELRVSGGNNDFVQAKLGMRVSRGFQAGGLCWTPEFRAHYAVELADDDARVNTAFNSLRPTVFSASSGDWGRHSGIFGAGIEAKFNERFDARLDYDFQIGERSNTNQLSLSFGLNW